MLGVGFTVVCSACELHIIIHHFHICHDQGISPAITCRSNTVRGDRRDVSHIPHIQSRAQDEPKPPLITARTCPIPNSMTTASWGKGRNLFVPAACLGNFTNFLHGPFVARPCLSIYLTYTSSFPHRGFAKSPKVFNIFTFSFHIASIIAYYAVPHKKRMSARKLLVNIVIS